MVTRTIPITELADWSERANSDPELAVAIMKDWIRSENIRRASSLPDMFTLAASESLTGPGVTRQRQSKREDATLETLKLAYISKRGVKSIAPSMRNKLLALARFCTENDVTTFRPIHRMFLTHDGIVRVSLPNMVIATLNRRVVCICLHYADAPSIFDLSGVTTSGKSLIGAIAHALVDKGAVDEHGEPAAALPEISDIVLLDISRQKRDAPVRTTYFSEFGGLFLADFKSALKQNLEVVNTVYNQACAEIGIDLEEIKERNQRRFLRKVAAEAA